MKFEWNSDTIRWYQQALISKGILYSNTEISFEFGQPFVSMEEVKNFLSTHSPKISPENLEDFISSQLIETGEKQYPFYIPRLKSMALFEIEGEL